ncbi:MAG: DUF2493 domain-containing protein [Clostridiales bacterium]|nr:DUF2493 domain-containing protein [Clostridiales bacterium]
MKVAIIGSRDSASISEQEMIRHIPVGCSSVISGGAEGIDSLAAQAAETLGLPLIVVRPDYDRYGKAAPIVRNHEIVRMADFVLAFWDGVSKGTQSVLVECIKTGKPFQVLSP